MHEYRYLRVEFRERTAVVTINRPEVLNALNRATLEELAESLTRLAEADHVGAVVLTGAGEKSFVAGADIREFSSLGPLEARKHAQAGQEVLAMVESCPKPVIAAINGFCLGGGCELALACHIRLASARARFGLPEVKLGLIPGYGGTQRLPRLIGRGKALHLILSGEMIEAAEAARFGLVDRVVPPEELMSASLQMADAIAQNAPLAVRYALEAVRSGADMPLSEGLSLESGLFGLAFATEDVREGVDAFLNKRPPSFRGR